MKFAASRRALSLVAIATAIALLAVVPSGLVAPPASALQAGDVAVNEVVASNRASLVAADGSTPDWIEIHNPSAIGIDLAGAYLSDSLGAPLQWQFPSGTRIAAGGYLVVFASGTDRIDAGGSLHTNFKLSAAGEEVLLTDADGATLLSHLEFPGLATDGAYGTTVTAPALLDTPTPGSTNSAAAATLAMAPTALIGNSIQDLAFVERLISATPGATVHYTIDGSAPTISSPLAANGEVPIAPASGLTTLRAIAVAPQMNPSPPSTFTYVHPNHVAESVGGGEAVAAGVRSLPVVSIVTASTDDPAVTEGWEGARVDYVDLAGDGFSETVGIKRFGSASLRHDKQSFRINFSSAFGATDLDYPLFADRAGAHFEPTSTHDQLELRSYGHDAFGSVYWGDNGLYLANEFGRALTLDLGSLNAHGRPVTVFVNGSFRGLYQFRERINDDWMSEYLGGDGDDYESWVIDDRQGRQELKTGSGALFTEVDFAPDYQQVKDIIEPRSLIHSSLSLWNMAFYWEKEWKVLGPSDRNAPSGLHFLANDLDLAFDGLYLPGRSPGLRDFLDRFAQDPEFLSLLQSEADAAFCGSGALTEARTYERFDRLAAEIAPAMPAEVAAWNHGSVASWESQVTDARERIASGIAATRAGWAAAGWFLGCDGEAPSSPATQSSDYSPTTLAARAVDGDPVTFTATGLETEPWWTIDLGEVRQIGDIVVGNRLNCCPERLADFHVFISEQPFVGASVDASQSQAGVLDLPFAGLAGDAETFNVDAAGRFVRIQLAGRNYLSLGEVTIEHVALPPEPELSPARQSSNYSRSRAAGEAIDGDATTFSSTRLEAEPWWTVDLGEVRQIRDVVVGNRLDCCAERLSDFHVFVSDDPFTGATVAESQSQPGVLELAFSGSAADAETFEVNRSGRFLRVQLSGENYLSLGEVTIDHVALAPEPGPGPDPDPEPSRLILNEWNAVDSDRFLKDGGTDSALGTVIGNGGDWFELAVIEDHLDIRGWSLELSDNKLGVQQVTDTLTFADQPLLADLRAGTIITVAESFADDPSYDPSAGDWHINLQANLADEGTFFTVESQSNFAVNNSDWQLVIRDDAGGTVFGPAGEGVGTTGVSSEEIGELEADPSTSIVPTSAYDDGTSSTFGLPNEFGGLAQNFDAIRPVLADTSEPDSVVVSPLARVTLTDSSVLITGLATDDAGVAAVSVALRNAATGEWLRRDGSFGAFQFVPATVELPGSAATGWSFASTLTEGRWSVVSRAEDTSGNRDSTRSAVSFDVVLSEPDTTEPDATFVVPVAGEVVAGGSVTISGQASDDSGVGRVDLSVKNRDTGEWLRRDGTLGRFEWLPTALDAPDAAVARWSITIDVPDGRWAATARAIDSAGNVDSTRPRVQFVVDSVVQDVIEPDTSMVSPTTRETVPVGAVSFAGAGTDDVGVARVRLTVQDRVSKLWLQPDGSFGSFALLEATVASPGELAADWSFVADLPAGDYAVTARSVDAAGNTDSERPRVRFFVAN